jgi:hypothetical protein
MSTGPAQAMKPGCSTGMQWAAIFAAAATLSAGCGTTGDAMPPSILPAGEGT